MPTLGTNTIDNGHYNDVEDSLSDFGNLTNISNGLSRVMALSNNVSRTVLYTLTFGKRAMSIVPISSY